MDRFRDGGRRVIDGSGFDAASLSEEARTTVGRSWLSRAKNEHLAVGAFSTMAAELAEAGCAPVVLSLITRAASDEVRHTDVCRRYAMAFLPEKDVPERWMGVPNLPRHEGASTRDRALLHVVEMCCLNETFTGIYFTEMLQRATNASARAALESLLEDEIDHGRVGWAHLSQCVREGWGRAVVEAALPTIVERSVGPIAAAGDRKEPRGAESHGWLSAKDGAAIYREALVDVVFRGFEELGVDLATTRAHAIDRGILAR